MMPLVAGEDFLNLFHHPLSDSSLPQSFHAYLFKRIKEKSTLNLIMLDPRKFPFGSMK